MKQRLSLLSLAAALITFPAVADDHGQHHGEHHSGAQIEISNAWSRPTPPGAGMGVGYMAISNHGDQAVTLVSANTDRAGHVSLHQTSMHDGLMKMQPLAHGLEIPAGQTVQLEPQGYHLMLEKLTMPLKAGEHVPVTLEFEGAETRHIELMVRSLDGEMGHSNMGHSHMNH
ncbi:metal-binding protein [Marinobacter fuscus]|uniref:Metal-binding protein n=1 Tax=Marinobacter fuscus TaxID=2109942 RepID=A0A2T1KKQ2_9GAMM|nr:copper chaperone PCu(A)C [Marinobacter fuscus]PSF10709.1 metal-binding protein [Marinobacter fuscus]